ncbi:hypothetical protein ACFPRL_32335 [Pseudoclavibacter helvolus]
MKATRTRRSTSQSTRGANLFATRTGSVGPFRSKARRLDRCFAGGPRQEAT